MNVIQTIAYSDYWQVNIHCVISEDCKHQKKSLIRRWLILDFVFLLHHSWQHELIGIVHQVNSASNCLAASLLEELAQVQKGAQYIHRCMSKSTIQVLNFVSLFFAHAVCTRMHVCAHTHPCTHTTQYIRTYVHNTYITHIHTHTHTQTHVT